MEDTELPIEPMCMTRDLALVVAGPSEEDAQLEAGTARSNEVLHAALWTARGNPGLP